jgi:hypothetical protein
MSTKSKPWKHALSTLRFIPFMEAEHCDCGPIVLNGVKGIGEMKVSHSTVLFDQFNDRPASVRR